MPSPLDALLLAAGGAVAGALAATNGAPTAVALTNKVLAIDENTATASHIKVADIVVVDDVLGTNTLGLTGADAAFFEIAGTSLYLKAGTVLDYEAKTSYSVAVTVDDSSVGSTPDATSPAYALAVGNVVDTALEFALVAIGGVIGGALTPVNLAPTAVVLTNTVAAIDENTATTSHIKVADIAAIDDAFGTNTLDLTGADAGFFEIVGTSLYLKAGTALDYETKTSYAVAVTVDDTSLGATPAATSLTYTLAVADVNEAPTAVALTNTTAAVNENTTTASHTKVADIVMTDDALGTNTLGLTGADAGFFEIVGTSLYLKAGTVLDYETKTSYAVAVTVDDTAVGSTPDATSATYTLAVADVNEQPAGNTGPVDTAPVDTAPDQQEAGPGTGAAAGGHPVADTSASAAASATTAAFDAIALMLAHAASGFGTPLVGSSALPSFFGAPANPFDVFDFNHLSAPPSTGTGFGSPLTHDNPFDFGFGTPFGTFDFEQLFASMWSGSGFGVSQFFPDMPTLAAGPFGTGFGTPLVASGYGDHF